MPEQDEGAGHLHGTSILSSHSRWRTIMSVRRSLQLALGILFAFFVAHAEAWIRSPATSFAELPPGTAHPEGIAADAAGNLYVADFDVSKSSGPGNVIVFDHAGKLARKLDVAGSSPLLLGLAFQPHTGKLLVLDFGAGNVLDVDPQTGAATVFSSIGPPPVNGINALTFDGDGNVYVADSFAAKIWKIPAAGGPPASWVFDPVTLGTSGVPPFGANGLAFNNARDALFVANTGNDTIVKIPVDASLNPGTPAVFVNSINGADGLIIDADDNLWFAANQADEIVVVDPSGKAIAKLGDFDGLDPRGMARGLLFPASLVFSGGFVYVTNLALDLEAAVGALAVDSAWAAAVKRFNVARIRAQIPPVR
jgi:sugar lactone lactonase YvrE